MSKWTQILGLVVLWILLCWIWVPIKLNDVNIHLQVLQRSFLRLSRNHYLWKIMEPALCFILLWEEPCQGLIQDRIGYCSSWQAKKYSALVMSVIKASSYTKTWSDIDHLWLYFLPFYCLLSKPLRYKFEVFWFQVCKGARENNFFPLIEIYKPSCTSFVEILLQLPADLCFEKISPDIKELCSMVY
jgi:hypothetical protein